MCTGAEIAALAVSAGGSLMGAKAQQDAINEQQRIAAEQAMAQLGYQDKASEEAIKHLEENYDPETREGRQEEIANERTQYLKQVLAPREGEDGMGQEYVGKVSDRYLGDRSNAVTEEMARAAELASLLGKTQAPTYLRQQEAISAGDLASALGMLGSQSAGSANVAQMKANAVTPNPWLAAGGAALTGYGQGMMTNTGGGTTSGTSGTGYNYAAPGSGMTVNMPQWK